MDNFACPGECDVVLPDAVGRGGGVDFGTAATGAASAGEDTAAQDYEEEDEEVYDFFGIAEHLKRPGLETIAARGPHCAPYFHSIFAVATAAALAKEVPSTASERASSLDSVREAEFSSEDQCFVEREGPLLDKS